MNLTTLRHQLRLEGWRLWAVVALLAYTLAGFLLLPWFISRQIVAFGETRLERPVTVEQVRFNPFALSLQVNGLELNDADGTAIGAIGELYVNFELSSLVRRAWTFGELRLTEPHVNFVRYEDGETNFGRVAASFEATSGTDPEGGPEDPGGGTLPRVIVQRLLLERGALDVADLSLETDFATRIEPIDLELTDFNTLPDEEGEHSFRVVTEYGADITWTGGLQANPPRLRGHMAVNGERPRLLWRYFQDRVDFEIADGQVTLGFDLDVSRGADGLRVGVANLSYELDNLMIRPKGEDQDVLRVPRLVLSGGRLEWPEQTIHLDEARISGARLNVLRRDDGVVNLMDLFGREPPATPDEPSPPTEDATPSPAIPGADDTPAWLATLDALVVEDLGIQLEDRSWREPLRTGLEGLNVSVTDFSTEPGSEFRVEVDGGVSTGGHLRASGGAALDPPTASVELDVEALSLEPLDAVVTQLSNLSVQSGSLTLSGRLSHDEAETAAFIGQAQVDELVTQDTIIGERFVAWRSLSLPSIDFALDARSLAIDSVALQAPYGKLVIKEDGTTNIGDLFVAPEGEAELDSGSSAVAAQTETPESESETTPMVVRIRTITLDDGSANFSDLSLPLPFTSAIHSLEGEITDIDSTSEKRSNVSLDGTVDESGRVKIRGGLTPYAPTSSLDIDVVFSNVHMPRLSPYSSKFAGRKIAGGTLNLDLEYHIENGELDSQNRIVIDRLKLGERVESPDAVSLPLDLAVALLKDSDGRIKLDIPVSGDVDDPDFDYGAVVGKTLGNVLVRVASAPFKLLGALLPGGGNGEKLQFVVFDPGSAMLAEGEAVDLDSVAAAIGKRPQLRLEVPSSYSAATDRAALQQAKLSQLVDSHMGPSSATGAKARDKETRTLEALYLEAYSPTELDNLKAAHTRSENGEPPELDADAYLVSLRRRLAEDQYVSTDELEQLARDRGQAILDYLTTEAGAEPGQLSLGEVNTVEPDENGRIRLRFEVASRPS